MGLRVLELRTGGITGGGKDNRKCREIGLELESIQGQCGKLGQRKLPGTYEGDLTEDS